MTDRNATRITLTEKNAAEMKHETGMRLRNGNDFHFSSVRVDSLKPAPKSNHAMRNIRGIIATRFVGNRGDDTTGCNKRHIIVPNCSVFQVNKA